MEAMRQKKVVVANPIGAWLLESPAVYPFLEQCCQHLLGEPLKMPSAASWWCGDKDACAHVIENMDTMVIKHFSDPKQIAFGHLFDDEQKQQMVAKITANPSHFVGQQMLNVSTMPCWDEHHLRPRPGILRTFTTATKNGYEMMPGLSLCRS